jgi:hypothetical protein
MDRRNLAQFSSSAHALRERRGLSVVLIAIVLMLLIVFVAMAVDYGRIKVTKVQLQNAADAGATAAATAMDTLPNGVVETQDRAAEAAAENFSLDQTDSGDGMRQDASVDLVLDEDVEFGRWNYATQTFTKLDQENGGIDERREANAVRVWGRRVDQYTDADGQTFARDTGLPLIFGSVFGQPKSNIQASATAAFRGGTVRYGFVGIDSVKFNGTTKTDSYNSAIESYPGTDGPNKNSSIMSDGDIELVGGTQIWGDVHPGLDHAVTPYPLGGNVEVTGYMDPLEEQIAPKFPMPVFGPTPNNMTPVQPYNTNGTYTNGTIKGANPGNFQAAKNSTFTTDPAQVATTQPTYFWFKGNGSGGAWTSGSQDVVTIDNTLGAITFFIDGDLKNSAQAEIHILSNNWPVTFHVNGNFDMQGGGIANDAATTPGSVKPDNLIINMTKPNTSLDIGGSPTIAAHIYAPGSDLKFHGNGNGAYGYWGWAVGKSLTVNGGFELHYDETGGEETSPHEVRLVD